MAKICMKNTSVSTSSGCQTQEARLKWNETTDKEETALEELFLSTLQARKEKGK